MKNILSHIAVLSRKAKRKISAEVRLFQNSKSIRSYIDTYSDVNFKNVPVAGRFAILGKAVDAVSRISRNYTDANRSILEIDTISKEDLGSEEFIKLAELFTFYGSDKASRHMYNHLYYHLLKGKQEETLNFLEIGLGTNNIQIKANMGRLGKPGASLYAFRDFLPFSNIYGADIDKEILFEDDRIKTFFIDQTNTDILNDVSATLKDIKFDLIIDDGLHNAEANFNTIEFALSILSKDGYLVIEDILYGDVELYHILASVLKDKFSLQLINCTSTLVCLIQHGDSSRSLLRSKSV